MYFHRIKVNFTPNKERVPVDHYEYVTGYIHKVLGEGNPYHGGPSDYSFSPILWGERNDDGKTLSFKNPYIIISSIDEVFMEKMITELPNHDHLGFGMKRLGMFPINEEFMTGWNHFFLLSPFILNEYIGHNKTRFVTLKDDGREVLAKKLREQMKRKLSKVDPTLNLGNFDVHIPDHPAHNSVPVKYNRIINFANKCKVSVRCSEKVAKIIYHLGIGQSTGIGFGSVCKTENLDEIYR